MWGRELAHTSSLPALAGRGAGEGDKTLRGQLWENRTRRGGVHGVKAGVQAEGVCCGAIR